ncbi:helix-turn-helix transcriptional regulator [Spirosoma sp. SC4-14]|uniref:helix-turn-helix domain-containing protein n=1 Tax=Spirosoma sp. SC4-14 TaxID=3128900 RepID=UPI0030D595E4
MTLVSDNIRYLRKLNGLTQEQFSRKINIKRSLLGAYEEGRANPNQQNIQAIAKAFNTTVELLTRQDLRKLRETPSLSIPLGQANKPAGRIDGSPIRSDGKLDTDDDEPFQHPDFPDIFAQPAPSTPEPKPLSAVLNHYYRPQEEQRRSADRPVPVPPVITPPVRPGQDKPVHERTQSVNFQPSQPNPVVSNRQAPSAVDQLFGPSDNLPSGSVSRQSDPLTFNNVYEGSGTIARTYPTAQSIAPTIPVVMKTHFGEYGQRYQQADYLHRLPAMHLPILPQGHYRAFEASDDFVFPGALLVGQFVRNWFDIADGRQYVLLVQSQRSEGPFITCRRVYNQVKIKGTLLLTADKAGVPNQEVVLKDVIEVWEVCAFVSQQMPPPVPNTDRLKQLVDELRFEVERL